MAGPILWLLGGASLLGLVKRVAIPPLAWIALIMLLHGSRLMPARLGLPCVWIALYFALVITQRDTVPASGPLYFMILAFAASTLMLVFAVDRLAAPRLGVAASTLVFPLALAAAEFLWSRWTPAASWGSIAYSQYGFLPLMQFAAVAGIWGITFLIGWCASAFEFAWSRGFDWTAIRGPVLTPGLVAAAIVLAGGLRLTFAPTDRPSIRTATLNRPEGLFLPGEMTRIAEGRVSSDERTRVATTLLRLQDWFLAGSVREARAGARLIVWPEQNLLILKEDEPAFFERAKRIAAGEHVYLAMGMGTIYLGDQRPFENKLVLIDPSGQIVTSHLKTRPVMGWEASIMRPGDEPIPVVATHEGRIAGAICFEADFPEIIHRAGLGDADLLVVPVNEWREIKDIHFQMHVFRAIENGVPLVRAAASGLSGAVDPWGRVLAVSDFFGAADRTLTAQVPVGRVPTLYAKTGDLFAWACVAGLVLAVGLAVMRPVKPAIAAWHPSGSGMAAVSK